MLTRATGHKPDVRKRPGSLRASAGRSSTPARSGAALPKAFYDLAWFVGGTTDKALPTEDQGNVGRCTVHSLAEAFWCSEAAQGRAPAYLDIHDGYVLAQRMGEFVDGLDRAAILDDGRRPEDLVHAAEFFGIPTCERDDPKLAEANALEDVWEEDVRRAATHTIQGFRRLDDGLPWDESILEAKRYVLGGAPGMFALDLDDSFDRYAGGVWTRPSVPRTGRGHMLSGPYGWNDDKAAFIVLNHWGPTWGTSIAGRGAGFMWLAYKTFASTMVSDRYFLKTAAK